MDIAGIRQELRYSQSKFGRALGIPIDTVRELERYTIVPSLAMRKQIKDLCDRKHIDMSKYELREAVLHLLRTRKRG